MLATRVHSEHCMQCFQINERIISSFERFIVIIGIIGNKAFIEGGKFEYPFLSYYLCPNEKDANMKKRKFALCRLLFLQQSLLESVSLEKNNLPHKSNCLPYISVTSTKFYSPTRTLEENSPNANQTLRCQFLWFSELPRR